MTVRRLAGVLAAVLVGTAAGAAVPGTAEAAGGYCDRGTGVTVVVDSGPLAAGTSIGCDPKGASTPGAAVVPRAGFSLTYVARQPGFVCRVSGLPDASRESCGNTPPADAYWGLFWSDGRSGRWSYANVGVGSLSVPAGGFIGWRFQSGGARTAPGPAPVSPGAAQPSTPQPSTRPTPAPTPKPSSRPTPTPTPKPSSRPTPTPTPKPSTRPTPTPKLSTRPTPTPTPTPSPTPSPGPARTTAPSSKPTGNQPTGNQPTGNQPGAARTRPARTGSPSPSAAFPSASPDESPEVAPSSDSNPSPGASTDTVGDLSAAERASEERATGTGAVLPLVAAGLLLVLLATAGTLAWRRRQG